jgi:hypothetical protein
MMINGRFFLSSPPHGSERGFLRFVKHNGLTIAVVMVLLIWILFLFWRISILGA